jgi:hypothetical protein
MGEEVIRIEQFGGGREKGGSVEVEGALHGLEGATTTTAGNLAFESVCGRKSVAC